MNSLITPDDVPRWIPGQITKDSSPLGWTDLVLKGYRYDSLDVMIPSMRDYMLVCYKQDDAIMSRRAGGAWRSEHVSRGTFSILTQGEQSQWKWDRPIDVIHLYLTKKDLSSVAEDVFERNIKEICMEDCIRTEDPILAGLMAAFENELASSGIGGEIYLAALRNQLCIHLLRRYAKASCREVTFDGRLTSWQRRRVVDFIEDNLDRSIKLEEIASELHLSVSGLIRKFQAEFNESPHAYVLSKRLDRSKRLLKERTEMPLRLVAESCGFSDASHMIRQFKRSFSMTPSEYRGQ